MTLTADTVLRRTPDAAWRKIDGQVAIISIDANRIRLLNGVGSFVWERCDGASVRSLIEDVCARYEVDRARAEHDVHSFVNHLVACGMVSLHPGTSP